MFGALGYNFESLCVSARRFPKKVTIINGKKRPFVCSTAESD